MPTLQSTHRVIALDFRGHGDSDRAPGSYDFGDYLSDAVAACEQIAHAPALVIGHSLGGVTAAALAQTRPDLVAAAVLEDPPLGAIQHATLTAEEREANALLAGFALLRQTIPMLQASGASVDDVVAMMAMMPSASGRPLTEEAHPDGVITMAEGLLRVDATVLDVVLDRVLTIAFDPERPVTPPLTVVAADPAMPDAVTQPADLVQMTRVNPGTRTHTMVGAGHLIHDLLVSRDAFSKIITDTVAGLG